MQKNETEFAHKWKHVLCLQKQALVTRLHEKKTPVHPSSNQFTVDAVYSYYAVTSFDQVDEGFKYVCCLLGFFHSMLFDFMDTIIYLSGLFRKAVM